MELERVNYLSHTLLTHYRSIEVQVKANRRIISIGGWQDELAKKIACWFIELPIPA
ncbi:MAG: hypothetical protein MK289_17875 [Trichodesmium sp. ALOHA_ZT_67]|nr:hypothetical protein [Trichodesmium sp. ALOHA_ZT_67]